MKILFVDNDGGGFADTIEVAADTTFARLFADHLPGRKADDYLIVTAFCCS